MSTATAHPLLRKLLVYGAVGLLVAIAVGLTAARLVLPFAAQYRVEVERRMSDILGQPVRIGHLNGRLEVLSPTLVLEDVQLFDKSGRNSIARFSEIRVGVAVFGSLLARAPVLDRMEVVGSRLTVERLKDGSFRVRGLARDPDQSDPEAMGRWLLSQHRILLRDSRVEWRDARTGRTFTFSGAAIELRNDGQRHRLNGRVELPGGLGGRLKVAVELQGNPLIAGGASGQVYLGGERLRPAGVLALFPIPGLAPGGGDVSFEVWGDWKEGRLDALQGRADGHALQFESHGRSENLAELAGRFAWTRRGDGPGWRLNVADLVLERAGRRWTPARLRVDLNGAGGHRAYVVQASFLRVEDLAAIAQLVPGGANWQQQLTDWEPRGDLTDARVELTDGVLLRAGAAFAGLGARASAQHPGFSGLDGYAAWGGDDVAIRLDTRDAQLELPNLFRAPLALQEATGEVRVGRVAGAWRVSSDGLSIANRDIRGRAGFTLSVPDQGAPFLDLVGDFRDGNAVAVPHYIPARIMPQDAVTWLDAAFKSGRVVRGGVLVHGRLDQFPFDHGEGRFEVRFDAANVDLDYMPGWPLLTNVAGEVVFDGRAMRIAAQQGQLYGGAVTATTVEIPDLVNAELVVKGQVAGELDKLFEYLRATGLAGHFSDALARFTAGGPYSLDLAFTQPLTDTTKSGRASGTVVFEGNRLLVAHGIEFTDVRGKLRFDDQRYASDAMTAHLFGAPARVRVDPADNGTATKVSIQGHVDSASLQRAAGLPLLARLHGQTAVDAQLLLSHEERGESVLTVRSPLTGMGVELPEPLSKRPAERRDLTARYWFTGGRADQLEVALSDRLNAVLLLTDPARFRAAFNFGSEEAQLPAEPGYVIGGRLPFFSPAAWKKVLAEARGKADGGAAAGSSFAPLPVRVRLDELGIVPAGEQHPGATAGDSSDGPPPRLDVRIGELRYGDLALGTLAFRTEEEANRVLLKNLSLAAPTFALTGSAQWTRGRHGRTETDLRASGKDLGAAAQALGIASVVSKGSFDLQGHLAWEGEPQQFGTEHLTGILKVKLKDGTIAELKPGAGRLIGLLSVHALPQRLTLDFRDLFEKGMRFRSVEGTFTFRDGNAFTDNLYMNALPAGIFVSGRTGLVKHDLDQTVTVVPDVSGTLPVAGGLVLGPQVGAALLLVQQLFHKSIDDTAKVKYTVTGSWDNPVVQRLGKNR